MRSGKRGVEGREHRSGRSSRMSCLMSARPSSRSSTKMSSWSRRASWSRHEVAQLGRHADVDREPDHGAAPAALERALESADQVFGLFLDLDVAVAAGPENALAGQLEAREQAVEEAVRTSCSSGTKADRRCRAGGRSARAAAAAAPAPSAGSGCRPAIAELEGRGEAAGSG